MSGGYGMSEWPDIDALYRRFDALDDRGLP